MHTRSCGILLAVSSLPGDYGVGTLGADARRFVDFLSQAGQHWWQVLPLVPLGEGNSPYMSPSAFAGEPLLIDPEALAAEGLLTSEELAAARWHGSPDRVDYDALRPARLALLRLAWTRAAAADPADFPWLADYVRCEASGSGQDAAFLRFLQLTFFRQWFALKQYANERGVSLMGDLPIYLSPSSVEVITRPELFCLRPDGAPTVVAGVPPDDFAADGQLWGNPLYDWPGHKSEVFSFWRERIQWSARLYDAVRIDHFRAFHTYWSIPASAPNACDGHWEQGPGMELVDALLAAAADLILIAEDLGDLDAAARDFLAHTGIPGMRVLPFAFDGNSANPHLPHNYKLDCVAYTGTHDTPTFLQWLFDAASPEERDRALRYLRLREGEGFVWGAISAVWASVADLAIAPFQDVLGLGADARMNTPGVMGPQNWSWRVRREAFSPAVSTRLRELTNLYGR